MSEIHPNAVIEDGAVIGEGVSVGPFCHVGNQVRLGDGVKLHSHVVVAGITSIGANTEVFPFASLGHKPQDLKFDGEASELVIGANNTIREYVTMNPGTEGGGMITRIGNNNLFMASSHVGHDCRVGDNVVMANCVALAGHVLVEEYVILGGLAAVLQRTRIGKHAMIGGMSGVETDIIPFGAVTGNRAHLGGLNLIGMKRRGFSRDQIHDMRHAYQVLFEGDGTLDERVAKVEQEYAASPSIMDIVQFIRDGKGKAICTPA